MKTKLGITLNAPEIAREIDENLSAYEKELKLNPGIPEDEWTAACEIARCLHGFDILGVSGPDCYIALQYWIDFIATHGGYTEPAVKR